MSLPCYMRRYSALPQVYVRVYACVCERCGFFINNNNNNNNKKKKKKKKKNKNKNNTSRVFFWHPGGSC